jgi:hypothetical protein
MRTAKFTADYNGGRQTANGKQRRRTDGNLFFVKNHYFIDKKF